MEMNMNPEEVGIKWSEMKFGGTDEAILHALPSPPQFEFNFWTDHRSFGQFGRRRRRCSSLRPSRILLSN